MTHLTDRYVAATLRAMPERSRGDIERELRATIADETEARTSAGATPEDAEHAALTALGDPARLAAGYTGRPLHLIGPEVFLAWRRTLTVVAGSAVPITFAVLLVVRLLAGIPVGESLVGAFSVALSVAVHIGFWVTLGFAAIERSRSRRETLDALGRWTPEKLPAETASTATRLSDTIAVMVAAALMIVLIVAQQTASVFADAGGRPIPILDPALWSFWLPLLIGVFALAFAVEAVKLARGNRWSTGFAVATTLLTLLGSGAIGYLLATGRLLNEEYFARFDATAWIAPGNPGVLIALAVVIASGAWTIVDAWRRTARDRRPAVG